MKIVVLDGYTLNPNDLNWSPLQALGETVIYDRTPPELVLDRCKGANVVITNKVVFDEAILAQLPHLQYIGVSATGYNVVDMMAAQKRGIVVTNVPAYGSDSVAQHTFALLLALTNHVYPHAQSVAKGNWAKATDWCYWEHSLTALSGKTMGIIGLGDIGTKVAMIARAFNMNILVHTRTPSTESSYLSFVDLPTLFEQSDFISLHLPLTQDNAGFVNANLLACMKKTAYLINTARGGLIHEQDLADALNAGKIAGVALDVLSTEPPKPNNPLLTAKNCLITPHNAWASREARQTLMDILVANVQAFLQGEAQNVVSIQRTLRLTDANA